jgi:hypothetical protein
MGRRTCVTARVESETAKSHRAPLAARMVAMRAPAIAAEKFHPGDIERRNGDIVQWKRRRNKACSSWSRLGRGAS